MSNKSIVSIPTADLYAILRDNERLKNEVRQPVNGPLIDALKQEVEELQIKNSELEEHIKSLPQLVQEPLSDQDFTEQLKETPFFKAVTEAMATMTSEPNPTLNMVIFNDFKSLVESLLSLRERSLWE